VKLKWVTTALWLMILVMMLRSHMEMRSIKHRVEQLDKHLDQIQKHIDEIDKKVKELERWEALHHDDGKT